MNKESFSQTTENTGKESIGSKGTGGLGAGTGSNARDHHSGATTNFDRKDANASSTTDSVGTGAGTDGNRAVGRRGNASSNEPSRGSEGMQLRNLLTAGRTAGTKLETLVKEKPYIALAGVGAAGVVLGGLLFSRIGRLAVLGFTGYAANQLWLNQGGAGVQKLMRKLTAENP